MTPFTETFIRTATIGIGATVVMDLWQLLLKALNIPPLNFAMLGRWVGHMAHGKWAHDAIAKAAPMRGELALGWTVHYATGIGFAVLFVVVIGLQWLRAPTMAQALLFGIATVLLPLLVMQPALGAGVASWRTKTPIQNTLKSLVNHTVFGLGLYATALVTQSFLKE